MTEIIVLWYCDACTCAGATLNLTSDTCDLILARIEAAHSKESPLCAHRGKTKLRIRAGVLTEQARLV